MNRKVIIFGLVILLITLLAGNALLAEEPAPSPYSLEAVQKRTLAEAQLMSTDGRADGWVELCRVDEKFDLSNNIIYLWGITNPRECEWHAQNGEQCPIHIHIGAETGGIGSIGFIDPSLEGEYFTKFSESPSIQTYHVWDRYPHAMEEQITSSLVYVEGEPHLDPVVDPDLLYSHWVGLVPLHEVGEKVSATAHVVDARGYQKYLVCEFMLDEFDVVTEKRYLPIMAFPKTYDHPELPTPEPPPPFPEPTPPTAAYPGG